jgi:YVTN family beta-propeller protein
MSHVAGSELAPGTTVAGYRVETLIGRGGMGAVYRAVEEGLARKVALKVIAPELARDERFRERFLRESRVAASLDHPHVIPIYQAGEEEGVLYLAMRYVEGTDLAKLLAEEGALEPARALEILSQVAEALDAAHEKGLVHRDVKPSNVLIASAAGREHCYLADFGLTKRTGSLSGVSAAGEIVGTLEYVAPEQITGAELDERADVYSLGCVLYECLTGQSPFPRATDVALLWAHVHEEPTPPSKARPELPRELDSVLARALAKEPGRRYRSTGELIAATRSAHGIEAVSTKRSARRRTADLVSRARAHPRALIAAAAVAVVAAVLAAVLLSREPAPPITVPPNHVGMIDPASSRVVETVQVGIQPSAVAGDSDGMWVANGGDQTLMRVDPTARQVERTIPLEGTPTGVALAPTGVWLAYGLSGSVARVDPQFGAVVQTIEDVVSGSSGGAIAVGGGAVWVVSRSGELARINPGTGRVKQVGVGVNASAIAVGEGSVWVANGGDGTVSLVNPRTFSVVRPISVGRGPTGVAVGEGAVWVTNREDGTVTRIDPSSLSTHTITVGAGPTGIAAGAGAVWVANRLEKTVSRIDPETRTVTRTIPVGNPPEGVAVAGGLVWVTVQAP